MREKSGDVSFIKTILKGTISSVIATLVGVLLFAIVVRFSSLGTGAIKAVNQFIKVISLFLGCALSVREKNGLIKGAFIGAVNAFLVYVIFAFIGGEISFGAPFVLDIIFQSVVGGICGVISVNVKR